MKNHYLICFLMTTLLYLNFAEKSYAQKHKTNMMIFSEVAGADEIVAGNYSKAIEQMKLETIAPRRLKRLTEIKIMALHGLNKHARIELNDCIASELKDIFRF